MDKETLKKIIDAVYAGLIEVPAIKSNPLLLLGLQILHQGADAIIDNVLKELKARNLA